jgi:O-antigen ligase
MAMIALAGVFLANILFVALARTALVVIVVLIVLFGLRYLTGRGLAVLSAGVIALAALSWTTSGYLRWRVENIGNEIRTFSPQHDTSTGARLAFWKDSIAIVGNAPLLGHGTGSIRTSFARQTGIDPASPGAATNPHNQIFAVAIQLGIAGVLVLIAMWAAHGGLFLARDAGSWIGLIVVVQNVIGSLFNSHLFDFTPGWIYVFGVGVAGGLVLRHRGPALP